MIFHLQCAVYRIMKKKFEKEDWPKGKLGDSKTSSSKCILNGGKKIELIQQIKLRVYFLLDKN